MIGILVPRLGQPREVFIDRHIYGMKVLDPVVLTLSLGERPVNIPTEVVNSPTIINIVLSGVLERASEFWNEHVMNRPHIWEAKCLGAGHKLGQYLTRSDIELVVVHFANMGTSFISQLNRVKVPIVIICHGSEIHSANGHRPYLRRLRLLFDKSSKVLCVSKYIMEQVLEYGCPPEKAEVFYLGAELPDTCLRNLETKERLRYVMTGGLVQIKGHVILINSFAKLLHSFKNAELVLIGDGILHGKLQSLCYSLGIRDAVKFLGFQENSIVYEELKKSDVYVHSSYNEGLGISVVEAMACSLPVIATNVGGIPEVVEDGVTGLLVPPGNVNRLAQAMEIMAVKPLLRQTYGTMGRYVVEKKFDVRKQNAHFVELLQKLIASRVVLKS